MNQSIRRLLLMIAVTLIPIIILIIWIYNMENNNSVKINKFNSQITEMYIQNSDYIYVKQAIDVKNCIKEINNKKEKYEFNFPILTKEKDTLFFSDIEEFKSNIPLFNSLYSKMFINQFTVDGYQHNQLIKEFKENNYIVSFSYKIEAKKILSYFEKKENICMFLVGNKNFRKNNDLFIYLPKYVQITNNDNYIEYKDNIYKINLKRENIDYKVNFNGYLKINNLESRKNSTGAYHSYYVLLNTLVVITIMLTLFIFYVYILKKTKIEKEQYKRDTKNIIEPILAESIIDGKIDAKNLIMTCIVNLIYKKKIENLDNNSIKLIDVRDLSDIEKEILKIVFATSSPIENYEGKIANLSDLDIIFKEENQKTIDIYDRFNRIKKTIKNQLFELNLINSIWDFLLKRIREISGLITLNSLIILCNKPDNLYGNLKKLFPIIIIINIFVYICISKKELIVRFLHNKEILRRKSTFSNTLFFYISGILLAIINLHFIDIEIVLCLCFVIITNLIIFKLSNTYVLTAKGKEEYKKAYMLKKYLIDYSLIEQRDLDGLVIFDEYLIYATAFGIPSKITRKISENMLNLNIKLQVISNFFVL